jgi:hypothetical protein
MGQGCLNQLFRMFVGIDWLILFIDGPRPLARD